MTIASHVPATIRSSADSLICVRVGLSSSCPSSMPTRTHATGPPCGMPLICSAHDAPVTASVAGSCSWSVLSTVATIWTSLRKSFGKERPHRAVDHPARDRRGLARPALAAWERPGDAPDGVELLLVVARQREEVDALSRRLRCDRGDEDHRVTAAAASPRRSPARRCIRSRRSALGRRSPFQMFS